MSLCKSLQETEKEPPGGRRWGSQESSIRGEWRWGGGGVQFQEDRGVTAPG